MGTLSMGPVFACRNVHSLELFVNHSCRTQPVSSQVMILMSSDVHRCYIYKEYPASWKYHDVPRRKHGDS